MAQRAWLTARKVGSAQTDASMVQKVGLAQKDASTASKVVLTAPKDG